MPYVSDAQRRWAHTPTGIKALGGKAKVREWDKATKGKKLPERVKQAAFVCELVDILKEKSAHPLLALVARHQLKPAVGEAIEGMEDKASRGVRWITTPMKLLAPMDVEHWDDVMRELGPSEASSGRSSGGMGLRRLV